MSDELNKRDQARQVITISCQMLEYARKSPPLFSRGVCGFGDDCYVLLDDATRLFCSSVSESLGEPPLSRWSAILPRLLFDHPDRCQAILAMIENRNYHGVGSRETTAA